MMPRPHGVVWMRALHPQRNILAIRCILTQDIRRGQKVPIDRALREKNLLDYVRGESFRYPQAMVGLSSGQSLAVELMVFVW